MADRADLIARLRAHKAAAEKAAGAGNDLLDGLIADLGKAAAALAAPAVTEEMVERGARKDSPDIWHDDRVIADKAAFPYDLDYLRQESLDRVRAILTAALGAGQASFQARVQPWMMACFGPEISADQIERNHRFLEEALELVQSLGCTASEAHQLVDYVFGRPAGEPNQEVGGVMVTLAALCLAAKLDMHEAGETELARVWTMVEKIRAKQAAKPKHSPLPEYPSGTTTIRPPEPTGPGLTYPGYTDPAAGLSGADGTNVGLVPEVLALVDEAAYIAASADRSRNLQDGIDGLHRVHDKILAREAAIRAEAAAEATAAERERCALALEQLADGYQDDALQEMPVTLRDAAAAIRGGGHE